VDPPRRGEAASPTNVPNRVPPPEASSSAAYGETVDETVRAAVHPRPLLEIDIPPGPLSYWERGPVQQVPAYPEDAETMVTGLRTQFLRCFEGNPDARWARPSGIAVTVTVAPNGEVAAATTKAAYGAPSAGVQDCVSTALKRVSFGPPGGGHADVKVTVHFRPQP
jgi:hypothetical protein